MKTLDLKIKGMHCVSCEKIIKMELEDMPGVENMQIDHKTGKASLQYNPDITSSGKIIEVISQAGYEATN